MNTGKSEIIPTQNTVQETGTNIIMTITITVGGNFHSKRSDESKSNKLNCVKRNFFLKKTYS